MSPAAGRSGLGRTLKDALATFTPVVRVISIACVVIWLLELFTVRWWEATWAWLWLDPAAVLGHGLAWQLVTYQFLHDPVSPMHVAWNVYALWLFGRWLEQRWGSRSFLTFYLVCGVGAGVVHLAFALLGFQGARVPVVGASGALMGVFVAAAMIWPHRKLLFMFVIPIELRFMALFTVAITLLMAWNPSSGVANFAHLGGMATGWIYLRWGWRLGAAGSPLGRAWAWLRGLSRRWRRRRIKVVDRDFDEWLRGEMDDSETKH